MKINRKMKLFFVLALAVFAVNCYPQEGNEKATPNDIEDQSSAEGDNQSVPDVESDLNEKEEVPEVEAEIELSETQNKAEPSVNKDAIERLSTLSTELKAIRVQSLSFVQKFMLNANVIIIWRQILNEMDLGKDDVVALAKFIEYIEYASKLEDKVEYKALFPSDDRYEFFRSFYNAEHALTEKQKIKAYKAIDHVVHKVIESQDKINETFSRKEVVKAMGVVEEKLMGVKKRLAQIASSDNTGNSGSYPIPPDQRKPSKDQKESLELISDAAKELLKAINNRKIRYTLFDTIFESLDYVDENCQGLIKKLNELCFSPK